MIHAHRRMLQIIAHAPCTAHRFTHGESMGLSPSVASIYLGHLMDLNFIACERGVYSITNAGASFLTADVPAPARTYCNASVRQTYVPPKWTVRDGGDDHQRHRSRGIGA